MGFHWIRISVTPCSQWQQFKQRRYISDVLKPVEPFIQEMGKASFQQDNARQHVIGIVRTFLDTENLAIALGCTFYRSHHQ